VPGDLMLFNSFIFLIFLGFVLPVHRLLSRRYRNLFLLAASYVFYGYWDWRFLFLILASTVLDFSIGRALHRTEDQPRRKLLLLCSVIGNLSFLGFFKYFNFFVDSFADLASIFGLQLDFVHLHIILPVGISFYTFQTMSYTLDIYRRKFEPTDSFANFALFVAFFPQLVAGPIERAAHLLPQIEKKPLATRQDFNEGFALIATGLFKKVMIGDTCGRIVDQVFAEPSLYMSPELLMGVMLFAVQVYADFSGYSNIARGTARFFGIHIIVNFEQPYLSANITELWKRWHISLSRWIRDYVYIALGGNRKGAARTYLNIMIAMTLVGLWHGAMWTFVVWGVLQGVFLCAHKLMLRGKKPSTKFDYTTVGGLCVYIFKVIGTHGLFLFGLLFFRAQSFGTAWYMLKRLALWEAGPFTSQVIMITASYYAITIGMDLIEYWAKDHTYMLKVSPVCRTAVYAAALGVTLAYMFQAPINPFVYFQF
jgi:D-alanyl-lipoteichoic acid acyltransferase DltB (MBOAT superfamily)